MTFGEKLQYLRKSKGMSQEQLASIINVSRQAVSKWELNDSLPDVENILQLSKLFEVSIDYLLKDDIEIENTLKSIDNVTNNKNTAYTLSIASFAFIAIGLLLAIGGWYENQNADSIVGGLIVQIVGIVAYFIARKLSSEKLSIFITIIDFILLMVMPVSIVSSIIAFDIISPYPLSIKSIIIFLIGYTCVCIIGVFLIRKFNKK